MPLTPSPGFLSAQITTSGISIYQALRALDTATSWPASVRTLYIVVTGAVTLSDGKHAVATAIPPSTWISFGQGASEVDVYLDSMIVAGGGTLACWLFT